MLLQRVLWFEPFWVLLLGIPLLLPGKVVPTAWQPVLVAMILLGWPLRWLAGSGKWHDALRRGVVFPLQSPLSLPVCIMLIWLPVNLWASVEPETSWVNSGYLVWGMALFVALINWQPARSRPLWLGWAIAWTGVALALFGPFLVTAGANSSRLFQSVQQVAAPLTGRLGETINPNILAGGLVLVIPLLVALALPAQPEQQTASWLKIGAILSFRALGSGVLALLVIAVLLATQSRGALLAAVVASMLVLQLRWPRLLWALPVVLAGAVIVVIQVGPMAVFEQIGSGGAISGWDERVEIWSRAVYALQDFAFTGIGIGMFSRVIPLLYPYFLISPGEEISHAHNLMLQVGVDLGLPGLIAYLALMMNLFVMAIHVLRRQPRRSPCWVLAAGALGSLVGLLVHGLLDAATWGAKLAFMPWLLYALIAILFLNTKAEKSHFFDAA